ncbi:MAG: DUF3821 domain-containing protein, partial [Methanoregula sp.]|nr:DUF3821 domain-containing protein [Methanoregula sp.]
PYSTGSWWDTANSAYSPGTYTIWAECNVNRMKDNYDVIGKTESTKTIMQNTERNPLMSVSVPTTSPTNQVTQITTTIPQTSTTIPTTSPTTAILTTAPIATATTIPQTSTTTIPAPVGTTTKKSPGFGIVLTVIAVAGIVLVTLNKRI